MHVESESRHTSAQGPDELTDNLSAGFIEHSSRWLAVGGEAMVSVPAVFETNKIAVLDQDTVAVVAKT